MPGKLRILVVSGIPSDILLLESEIERIGLVFTSRAVASRDEFVEALRDFQPEIILLEYAWKEFDGLSALRLSRERALAIPFIMIVGPADGEIAVACMKVGADECVFRPELGRLGEVIRTAIDKRRSWVRSGIAAEVPQKIEAGCRSLFENCPISLWEEDFSGVKDYIDRLRKNGVTDFSAYFTEHP